MHLKVNPGLGRSGLFVRAYIILSIVVLASACTRYILPDSDDTPVELPPGNFQLLPDSSFLYYQINSNTQDNPLAGGFSEFNASLNFNENRLQATTLNAVINIASLEIGDAELGKELLSRRWFNRARFPVAHFSTESVDLLSSDSLMLNGIMTLRGVSKPLTLDVRFIGGANNLITGLYTLAFTAKAHLNRSDYGLGGWRENASDVVNLELYGEFIPVR